MQQNQLQLYFFLSPEKVIIFFSHFDNRLKTCVLCSSRKNILKYVLTAIIKQQFLGETDKPKITDVNFIYSQ